MRRLTAAPLVLLSVGCLLGPDYERPTVETPPTFLYEVADAQATADTAWWRQFGDPVLDSLVDEAVANNKNIKIAAANVEQAASYVREVRSPLYPQAGVSATGGESRFSESGAVPLPKVVPNPNSSYELVGSVSWELDLWGRVRRLTEAARASLLASEEGRRGVILSVVASVANSYLELRALDEQLTIARRTLETYAESVRLFELQYEYGFKSQMTVEQARISYETAAAKIPQLESQVAQTENLISTLLGRNPGPIQRGKSILELTLPAVPAGVPSQLLERRPDICQAEQNLIAVNAQLGAAKALYFPTISLTGLFGQSSADLKNLFQGPARVWSYGGSITGPLFTGGAVSAQVRQVEAARQAAVLDYEATIQSAFADVDDALVARAKLIDQVAAQERLVAASREYARLARLQFNGGVTPYFTVLQAELQLFPAELDLISYHAALFSSTVNLYKAMGGGWAITADATHIESSAPSGQPASG
jgi:multidrug efflux system outer membrane protein